MNKRRKFEDIINAKSYTGETKINHKEVLFIKKC